MSVTTLPIIMCPVNFSFNTIDPMMMATIGFMYAYKEATAGDKCFMLYKNAMNASIEPAMIKYANTNQTFVEICDKGMVLFVASAMR